MNGILTNTFPAMKLDIKNREILIDMLHVVGSHGDNKSELVALTVRQMTIIMANMAMITVTVMKRKMVILYGYDDK
jgi:hypothetical protein